MADIYLTVIYGENNNSNTIFKIGYIDTEAPKDLSESAKYDYYSNGLINDNYVIKLNGTTYYIGLTNILEIRDIISSSYDNIEGKNLYLYHTMGEITAGSSSITDDSNTINNNIIDNYTYNSVMRHDGVYEK